MDGDEKRKATVPKGDILHQFRQDVTSGKLPTVSWLVPPAQFSDHPSCPWYGSWYVSEVLDILTANPEIWKKTIFILTYDENDGYFDHVPPFVAPDPLRPETGKCSKSIDPAIEHITLDQELQQGVPAKEARGGPIGLGFRVPMIVASPWSRGGKVCSQLFDHTSVLQFLEVFLSKKYKKTIMETNIGDWRRAISGNLTCIFGADDHQPKQLPFLAKEPFVKKIYNAKFKNPPGYKQLTSADIAQVNQQGVASVHMPKQEPGIRPSCALPYQLYAEGYLNKDKQQFEVTMAAHNDVFGSKAAGSPFSIYTSGIYRPDGNERTDKTARVITRSYAVAAGESVTDHWPVKQFEQEQYHLCLNGPNGFFRAFKGTLNDPEVTVEVEYERLKNNPKKLTGNVLIKLVNLSDKKDYSVIINDNAYKQGKSNKTLAKKGAGKSITLIILNCKKSFGWYDFNIQIEGASTYLRHYAGRVETGEETFTDPAMGLLLPDDTEVDIKKVLRCNRYFPLHLSKGCLLLLLMLVATLSKAQNKIQQLIDQAVADGRTTLTIPSGTYRLNFNKKNEAHVLLKGIRNLTINALGVQLICHERATAIEMINCKQVTLKGFEIDYEPMLFTQGIITAFAPDWSYGDVKIDDGYPNEEIKQTKVEIHETASGLLKTNVPTLYDKKVTKIADRVFRIYDINALQKNTVPGDKTVLYYKAIRPHGIYLKGCENTHLEQVTIYEAPGFAICENQCSQMYYDQVKIIPGLTPKGGTAPRLRSANDDGIHSIAAKIGPTITNCTIASNGDDGIAIHGKAHFVVACSQRKLTALLKRNSQEIESGDTIVNVNANGHTVFSAKVVSVENVTDQDKAVYEQHRDQLTGGIMHPSIFNGYQTYILDRDVAASVGSIIFSPNHQGNGFKVVNSKIANKRARGILIKSSNGIIEGNEITHVQMSGIVLSPEYNWMEAGNSHHVIIKNNRLTDCGFLPTNTRISQAGVISVSASTKEGAFADGMVHQYISITGNYFNNCSGTNILITSANDVQITNNIFRQVNLQQRYHGKSLGLAANAVVAIRNTTHAKVINNKIYCQGNEVPLDTLNVHALEITNGINCIASPGNYKLKKAN